MMTDLHRGWPGKTSSSVSSHVIWFSASVEWPWLHPTRISQWSWCRTWSKSVVAIPCSSLKCSRSFVALVMKWMTSWGVVPISDIPLCRSTWLMVLDPFRRNRFFCVLGSTISWGVNSHAPVLRPCADFACRNMSVSPKPTHSSRPHVLILGGPLL